MAGRNIATDAAYIEMRKQFERVFEEAQPVEGSDKSFDSPSGRYRFATTVYSTGKPRTMNMCRGLVTVVSSGELIADVKRNIGGFWHTWVDHPNGNEYLLCGEDYQGYSTINLSKRQVHVYFPEEGINGAGFCWSKAMPSPDRLVLAVDGCIWAATSDLLFLDFREPDSLPYNELMRVEDTLEAKGWKDNDTFSYLLEHEVRKSDGARCDSLDDKEWERLAADSSLTDFVTEECEVKRPHFPD